MTTTSLLPNLIEAVFKKIDDRLKSEGANPKQLSQSDLLELYGIFNKTLPAALELLDQAQITVFKDQRNCRSICQIVASSSSIYVLFPNINYCSCNAFKFQVLLTRKQYTCKHVLAIRIAVILDRATVQDSTESEVNLLMRHTFNPITDQHKT